MGIRGFQLGALNLGHGHLAAAWCASSLPGGPSDADFGCYLQEFVHVRVVSLQRGAPEANFCCYLREFVGVKAVSLERGAPEGNFCSYSQGFAHPPNSRAPGAPGGSWGLLGALTGHVPTQVLPDPNPTGRIPTQLARDTFPPNSHGTRSRPNQVTRQTGSQADNQTYRHTHMQQLPNT